MTRTTHYRVTPCIAGSKIYDFASSKELVQAIHDALVAHERAFLNDILHKDVSTSNILISHGRGNLVDWDLAKPSNPFCPSRPGTFPFMSAHLMNEMAVHTVQDDMESAFWVLLWTVLIFAESALSSEKCTAFMSSVYKSALQKKITLDYQSILQPAVFPGHKPLCKLLKTLANLFNYLYSAPPNDDERQILEIDLRLYDDKELMQVMPALKHIQALQNLKDHRYVITVFADHLKELEWPVDDAAKLQAWTRTAQRCCGWEWGNIALLQSSATSEDTASEERGKVQQAEG